MARKDTLNYTPTNNDHDLDNQPEPDLNHKDNWRPDSWEAHNPKLIDFRDSLDALNHTAAALMDNPQPVTGYPMVNRHQLVTDYARALNNVDFDHPPPPGKAPNRTGTRPPHLRAHLQPPELRPDFQRPPP